MSEYKFNQSVGRLQNTGEVLSAQVGGARAGTVTYIPPYKPSTGVNLGVSRIKSFQQLFKLTGHGDAPVFLRTPRDVLMYRGLMGLSVAGIALTLYGVGSMALGTMKSNR